MGDEGQGEGEGEGAGEGEGEGEDSIITPNHGILFNSLTKSSSSWMSGGGSLGS